MAGHWGPRLPLCRSSRRHVNLVGQLLLENKYHREEIHPFSDGARQARSPCWAVSSRAETQNPGAYSLALF